MKFLIINGPNLNLLGKREPGIYGSGSYGDLCALIQGYAASRGAQARCFQSNHEGAIIDEIHAADGVYDAIIINPGAYTHYSYAILDALKAVSVPACEVHISHIDRREAFRSVSVTAPACVGQIYGLGFLGYLRAMDHFLPARPVELCVIGDPAAHSLSPRIQSAMLSALGAEGSYTFRTVKRDELTEFLSRVREGEFTGFNATMPHKQALLPFMDVLDEDARLCGAVNTVCNFGGKLYGFNTDGAGLCAALKAMGHDPAGKNVTLLGAGGAAKAVALKLARTENAHVTVCNRTVEKARALAGAAPENISASGFSPEELESACSRCDILINCTSLGMAGQDQFGDFGFLSALPDSAAVCDLIYHPAETELLRRARLRGLPIMNGLPMLVWQGVLALEKFLDRGDLDTDAMAKAAFAALSD